MSNIKLQNLEKIFGSKQKNNPESLSDYNINVETLYKDIKFDLTDINVSGIFNDNSINSNISIKDIAFSTNENAIMNSIKNWFRTEKHTRLLNPELSINLKSYVFEKVDKYTAYFLAQDIVRQLPAYEPRVTVEQCNIVADMTNDLFIINLVLMIPSLNNKIINLKEILKSGTYL